MTAKSIICNNYTVLLRLSRLTFLAICFPLCLALVSCVNLPNSRQIKLEKHSQTAQTAININRATAEDLIRLPGLGKGTAKKIIEFREKNGSFRRAEHLLLVRGISDKKFREIQDLVKVE